MALPTRIRPDRDPQLVPGACLRPHSRPCRRPDPRQRVPRLSRPGRRETPQPSFPAAYQGTAKGPLTHPPGRMRRRALARTIAKASAASLWRGAEPGTPHSFLCVCPDAVLTRQVQTIAGFSWGFTINHHDITFARPAVLCGHRPGIVTSTCSGPATQTGSSIADTLPADHAA